jgi:uncharacterized protein
MSFSSITRRRFLRIGAGAAVAGLAVDSVLFEPNLPRVVRQQITLTRWPARLNGFTVCLLSDFHYDPYFSTHPLHAAVGMVNALRPDLIVLTGDFVSLPLFTKRDKKAAQAAEPCAQVLKRMHAPYGMWAVLGNHDFYSDPEFVTSALRTEGITVLVNQSAPIEANGARFWLSGLDDVLGHAADLRATLLDIPGGEATVLLAHEPDFADHTAHFPVDLQLSGHSHGGQVRVPFMRPLYLPELAQKYVYGLHQIGGLTLYTNPGLGTVGVPIRFNCPPEITLITLRGV